ncbi:MAG: HAD-IIB family hydrolase [archaeon]
MKPFVIFSDLDGTLLDHHTYSPAAAREALALVRKKRVPLVFCTSKTKSESLWWQKKLRTEAPFIVENGGAILIPVRFFSGVIKGAKKQGSHWVITLGTPYARLVKAVQGLKKRFPIVAFSDLSPEAFAEETGLNVADAKRALDREYDEGFRLTGPASKRAMEKELKQQGLSLTAGGRYHHVMGDNDKGRAVLRLLEVFGQKGWDVTSMAFGDSPNDFSMLDAVDRPFLVMRPDRRYSSTAYMRAGAVGPVGWNRAVCKELEGCKR